MHNDNRYTGCNKSAYYYNTYSSYHILGFDWPGYQLAMQTSRYTPALLCSEKAAGPLVAYGLVPWLQRRILVGEHRG